MIRSIYFVFFLFATTLLSCSGEDEDIVLSKQKDSGKVIIDHIDMLDSASSDKIWEYTYDESLKEYKPVKVRQLPALLTPDMVAHVMNKAWPDVQVKVNHIHGDTIFLDIPNSLILTQQMGTQGALEYMVSATFTFTELKGIRNVYFNFEEGDHAVPGLYNRKSWSLDMEENTQP